MSILQVKNVSKSFGGVKANVDISVSVEQGSIVGLASLFSIRLLRPPLATDFLTILRALHFGNSLISISHLTNHLIIY